MLRLPLAVCVVTIVALPNLALGAPSASGLPAKLESAVKVAFADIAKAKTALNAGNPKTSQSYLAKAEALLGSVLNNAPSAGDGNQSQNPSSTEGTTAASKAEGEVAKLDPSLAGKIGAKNENTTTENADAGMQGQPPRQTGQSGTIAALESASEKVTLARTLLKAGNNSKAKSVLDQIPSSPLALLKNASGR